MNISIIVAVSENNVIGNQGTLPWHLPKDMAYFKRTTMGHHVLMGRKNYESIPHKFRPLPGRTNLVLSRSAEFQANGVHGFQKIEEAISFARNRGESELFIIGGAEIYALALPLADRLYLTRILAVTTGDTFFPPLDFANWKLNSQIKISKDSQHAFDFVFEVYKRK